jgi:hypothetical protein
MALSVSQIQSGDLQLSLVTTVVSSRHLTTERPRTAQGRPRGDHSSSVRHSSSRTLTWRLSACQKTSAPDEGPEGGEVHPPRHGRDLRQRYGVRQILFVTAPQIQPKVTALIAFSIGP